MTRVSHAVYGKVISDEMPEQLSAGERVGIPGKKDSAMDSSAMGITAQAERGKGNGETTVQQTQFNVTCRSHIPNDFGKYNNTVPNWQQRQSQRAEAGAAARTMRLWGGGRRVEPTERRHQMGRLGESIVFWEERSWAHCPAMTLIALDKQCFLSREPKSITLGRSPPFPQGMGRRGASGKDRTQVQPCSPRGTTTAGRCSICKSQTNALSFGGGGGWAGPM